MRTWINNDVAAESLGLDLTSWLAALSASSSLFCSIRVRSCGNLPCGANSTLAVTRVLTEKSIDDQKQKRNSPRSSASRVAANAGLAYRSSFESSLRQGNTGRGCYTAKPSKYSDYNGGERQTRMFLRNFAR